MFLGDGIKVGKLFGIELRLDLSWFFLATLSVWFFQSTFVKIASSNYLSISWLFGIIAAALFFASLLIHELSHSLVGKKFGIPFKRITLFIFGGCVEMEEGYKLSAKSEFWMTLAGPLSSFVLAGLFFVLRILPGTISPFWSNLLACLFVINLFMGIFNLLPGFPMDGGRILRSLFWWKTGNLLRATQIAYWVGFATCLALFISSFWNVAGSPLWIGFIVFVFIIPVAGREYKKIATSSGRSGRAIEATSLLGISILLLPFLILSEIIKFVKNR